jgi:hypothetical protein
VKIHSAATEAPTQITEKLLLFVATEAPGFSRGEEVAHRLSNGFMGSSRRITVEVSLLAFRHRDRSLKRRLWALPARRSLPA